MMAPLPVQAAPPPVYAPPSRRRDRETVQTDANAVDRELEQLLSQFDRKIRVVGCGGGGCNTIIRLQSEGIDNCEVIAVNTDAQHLLMARVPEKILIGKHLTKGLGAGALPQIGEQAAMESEQDLKKKLAGSDLVFVTAGMGGGTGTGSAPVVAKLARDAGALTIAVVTFPFRVEGAVRAANAEAGLAKLRDAADTVIVIPNDKLLEIAPRLPLNAAFKVADEVLHHAIRGLTDMITKPGLVNLDFADLKTIMKKGGVAMIGLGESDGDNRAVEAVTEAIESPLLDVDVSGASGCLINVVGGPSMTLQEAESAVEVLYQRINKDARIIWGTSVDPSLGESVRVMVVLTGVKSRQILGPTTGRRGDASNVDFVL
ncbi:MAG: cell division protein FtsZ [Thermoplasmatota archaeon]